MTPGQAGQGRPLSPGACVSSAWAAGVCASARSRPRPPPGSPRQAQSGSAACTSERFPDKPCTEIPEITQYTDPVHRLKFYVILDNNLENIEWVETGLEAAVESEIIIDEWRDIGVSWRPQTWWWWSPLRCSTGCLPGMTDTRPLQVRKSSKLTRLFTDFSDLQKRGLRTFNWVSCNFTGSSLYPSKLGSEAAPGGASPYFSSSMQTAYGQQGESWFNFQKKSIFKVVKRINIT